MKNKLYNALFYKSRNKADDSMAELSQTELNNEQSSPLKKLSAFLKSIIPKLRFGFASACENSHIVCFVEELYAKFLSCQTRVLGVYFLSFCLVSMLIKYFNFNNFFVFIFSNEIIPLLFVFVISLILFTSKKEIGKLLTSSVLLSDFRITYSQEATVAFYTAKTSPQGFSTSFFLGVFSAFLTVIYPISSIFSFLAVILFLLCSINRPESALLFSIFLIPFLNTKGLFIIILITFFSLFYKFMRCKRHISFGVTELLMLVLCFCLATSTTLSNESILVFVKYVLPLLLAFVCMNIVRSTSLLKSCYKMLVVISSIYSMIVLTLFVSIVIFGYKQVMPVAQSHIFSSVMTAITDKQFSLAFISICVPIIFARLISTRLPYHLFTLIILLLYSSVMCSYYEVLIIVLSCFGVLCFYKLKAAFLSVSSLVIAYVITIPGNYLSELLHLHLPKSSDIFILDKFILEFKNNILFGNGFLAQKIKASGIGSLLLSCGIVGTLVLLAVIVRIIAKNIKFISNFDLTETGLKSTSAALCVSGATFLLLNFITPLFSDLRCLCLYAVVLSLTRNVQRCIKSDFVDPHKVREYEI